MKIQHAMLLGVGLLFGAGFTAGYFKIISPQSASIADLPRVIPVAISSQAEPRKDKSIYEALDSAARPAEILAALESLSSIHGAQPPISTAASRKVFAWVLAAPELDFDRCILAGHLAAISGDVELMREMVCTYFGSAEAESKGDYIEEFMQCHPELFFSQPDTRQLWDKAGGAEWCCDHPDKTIPILVRFAPQTLDAQKMLLDVRASATKTELAQTQWGEEARAALAMK